MYFTKQDVIVKQIDKLFSLIFALLFSPGVCWAASAISGGGGYNLGEVFNPQQVAVEKLQIDKSTVYKLRPQPATQNLDYLLLRLTPDMRIYRITIYSPEMPGAQCESEKNNLRKATEQRYPKLGYYAMDESEMFYEDPRTFTIECITSDNKTRLKTEYADDALADFKEK